MSYSLSVCGSGPVRALACVLLAASLGACSSAPDAAGDAEEATATTSSALLKLPTKPLDPGTFAVIPQFGHTCDPRTRITPDSFFVRTKSAAKACTSLPAKQGTWAGVDAFPFPGTGECRYTWTPASGEVLTSTSFMDYDVLGLTALVDSEGWAVVTPDCETTSVFPDYTPTSGSVQIRGQWVPSYDLQQVVPFSWYPRPRTLGCPGCRAVASAGMVYVLAPIRNGIAGNRLLVGFPGVSGYIPFTLGDTDLQRISLKIPAAMGVVPDGTEGTLYADDSRPPVVNF